MRSLRELWSISKPFYMDVMLGEFMQRRIRKIEKILNRLRFNVLLNKLIISVLLIVTGIYSARLSVIDVSAFYLMILFIVTFFFLHTMTSFVSKGFDLLYTLPLSDDEISKVKLLTFVRIFDIPLILLTISFPVAIAVFHGILSSIPALLCTLSIECLSLWLSLKFARFFYERISYSTSSPLATILRLITYIAWSVAIFGVYGISSVMSVLSKLKGFENLAYRFDFIFPFNYALLSLGIFHPIAIVTSVPLFILSVFALKDCIRSIAMEAKVRISAPSEFDIRPNNVIVAFLKKDLRVITRNPGLVILLIMPIGEAFLFGITFSHGPLSDFIATMVVIGFLPMIAFISVGIERRDLLTILPLNRRDMILSKALLGCSIYAISVAILLPKTILPILIFPSIFAMFVISCAMADSLEATKNIYAGIGPALLIIIVSYAIAYLPLVSGLVARMLGRNVASAITIPSLIETGVAVLLLSTL